MLRAWLADLASRPGVRGKVLSSASVSQAYRTLNRLLEAAVADELLGRNPLKGVKGPKVEVDEMRFLTHEEVGLLADTIDERYRALVLVAAYTGLRASELVGLRRLRTYAKPPPTLSCSSRPRAATSASTTSGASDRYGHLFPGQAESVADRLDEMAQAAGIVQRAGVVGIDRGQS